MQKSKLNEHYTQDGYETAVYSLCEIEPSRRIRIRQGEKDVYMSVYDDASILPDAKNAKIVVTGNAGETLEFPLLPGRDRRSYEWEHRTQILQIRKLKENHNDYPRTNQSSTEEKNSIG